MKPTTDLHPIELLILAALAVAAAIWTLADASHRIIRRPEPPAAAPVRQALAPARPARSGAVAPPPLGSLNVEQLRTLARQRLGSTTRIGGRRIAQARRADLLDALG